MGVVMKQNLGDRVKRIAKRRSIPENTVETIIKDYLTDMRDDLANGEPVVIPGLTSLSVVHNLANGDFAPQSRTSEALKQLVKETMASKNPAVSSV
jgi:nucleoid DNA-binding protein